MLSLEIINKLFFIIIKWIRALWLVSQLWFIVSVNGNFACLLNYYIKAINRSQVYHGKRNLQERRRNFITLWPVKINAIWATFINLLLANKMQELSASKWFFVFVCLFVCFHPTQVSTQVQLAATCIYMRVCLARALMAVFILDDALSVWTNLGEHL